MKVYVNMNNKFIDVLQEYDLTIVSDRFGYSIEHCGIYQVAGTNYVIKYLNLDKKQFLDNVKKWHGVNNSTEEYPNVSFEYLGDLMLFLDNFIIPNLLIDKFL